MKYLTLFISILIVIFTIGTSIAYTALKHKNTFLTTLNADKEEMIISNLETIRYKDTKIDSLEAVLSSVVVLKSIFATMYHPEASQCDNSPEITADGSKIDIPNASNHKWIAVSPDLLARNKGPFNFNDELMLISKEGIIGLYKVKDVMNKKWTNRIDFLESPGTAIYSIEDLTIIKIN